MNSSQLIFVRYATGSGGNYLISLLQSSNTVLHWNHDVESSKVTQEFRRKFLLQFKSNFQQDLYNHLKHEPHHPYNLDFISAKHPRGDELTFQQFVELLQQRNDIMLAHFETDKKIIMRLNKNNIPAYAFGSTAVNLIIDEPSVKWVNRMRYIKLHGYQNGIGILKESHPDFLKAKYKTIHFKNQYEFAEPKYSFIKNKVINDGHVEYFKNQEKLLEDPSNNNCNQINVNLSQLLTPQTTVETMVYLFKKLNLGQLDVNLIDSCATHFYNTNVKPYKKIL